MSAVTKLMTPGGGGVALTPASSIASDVTVNVPSQNCTLGIQGPAFSAYMGSGQAIGSGVQTKLQFNTKVFDTANCYNTSTYRFTPNVAGYYQISGTMCGAAPNSSDYMIVVYKNGSPVASAGFVGASGYTCRPTISYLVYLNGSTDYVELYGYVANAQTLQAYTAGENFFTGALVRAA